MSGIEKIGRDYILLQNAGNRAGLEKFHKYKYKEGFDTIDIL